MKKEIWRAFVKFIDADGDFCLDTYTTNSRQDAKDYIETLADEVCPKLDEEVVEGFVVCDDNCITDEFKKVCDGDCENCENFVEDIEDEDEDWSNEEDEDIEDDGEPFEAYVSFVQDYDGGHTEVSMYEIFNDTYEAACWLEEKCDEYDDFELDYACITDCNDNRVYEIDKHFDDSGNFDGYLAFNNGEAIYPIDDEEDFSWDDIKVNPGVDQRKYRK